VVGYHHSLLLPLGARKDCASSPVKRRLTLGDEFAMNFPSGIFLLEFSFQVALILHPNFYEKAHFVKPTWRPYRGRAQQLLPSALCFYPL
jgi:hypothetical protein